MAGSQTDGRPGMVPTFTAHRSAKEVPDSAPAASPAVRRRLSRWPPHRPDQTGFRVDRHLLTLVTATRCNPAHIHQIRAGARITGLQTSVPLVHLSASLAGPGPSGSAEPSRLRQDCSHPPRRPPAQAVLSFMRARSGQRMQQLQRTLAAATAWAIRPGLSKSTAAHTATRSGEEFRPLSGPAS